MCCYGCQGQFHFCVIIILRRKIFFYLTLCIALKIQDINYSRAKFCVEKFVSWNYGKILPWRKGGGLTDGF